MIVLNALKYTNRPLKNILHNRIARQISTVDPKDIEHHSALKNDWWDENGPIKVLHRLNPFRLKLLKDGLINAGFKIQNANLPLEGIKIVDVGCGGGILAEYLARAGAHVTGIDASAELINVAKEHVKFNPNISERVNYIRTTVEDFAQQERETYDALITSEVLEHVADPQLFVKECVKIVKPGKSIFITTINKTLTSWLSAIVACEYIFKVIPYGTHQWHKFISPSEVQRILENYGCETRLLYGTKLNPRTIQWSSSSSTSTFYGLHAIKQQETGM